MSALGVATVTHADAPLDLLERVSYVGEESGSALDRLRSQVGLKEAAILSTCNRTEIYALFDGPADPRRLAWFLAEDRGVCWNTLREHVGLHTDDDAVAHLYRVAAGVDSLAFGEAEIVAQIKAVHAELGEVSAKGLLGLFEGALRAGRAVRREVSFEETGASLGTVAVQAARRLAPSSSQRILLVGAGKIARSVLDALPPEATLVVASRTQESAERLAGDRGVAVTMAEFPAELALADVVFFCASSRQPILDAVAADAITAKRRTALVAVDLGLPRNVAAEVRLVAGIELVDLGGLRSHVGGPERIRTLTDVEPIIAREVARYREASLARRVAPLIAELRSSLGALGDAELDRAYDHDDPERSRSEQMVHRLIGRVLHGAIMETRRAAADGDVETLAALQRVFGSSFVSAVPAVIPEGSNKEEVA